MRLRKEPADLMLIFFRGLSSQAQPFIASAILDRLLHHSTTINIRGESYRLREKKKADLIGTASGDAMA